jgi:hypothetical protein
VPTFAPPQTQPTNNQPTHGSFSQIGLAQMNRETEQPKESGLATLNRTRRKRAFTFFCLAVCLFFVRAREEANFRANWYASLNYQTKMIPTIGALLRRWHGMLGLSRQSQSWYRDRLREELHELRNAKTPLLKLSETSDVIFSIVRAQYDGFPIRKLPLDTSPQHVILYAYMAAKFTSRWTFYRTLAMLCRAPRYDLVCGVVNPSKDHKLDEVASRHQIDPVEFKRIGRRLRRVWPLLP